MQYLYPSNKIYLAQSNIPKAGRGVFASKKIEKGEIIEICPVIELTQSDSLMLSKTVLRNYYFTWGKGNRIMAIGLGFSSIYNHSYDQANATYVKEYEEKTITYSAIVDILKDQEIVVNYNSGNPNDKTPVAHSDIPLSV